MFNNVIIKRLQHHISSVTLVALTLIIYFLGEPAWVSKLIPSGSEHLDVLLALGLVLVYELSTMCHKTILGKVEQLATQVDINALTHAVNTLYVEFKKSNDAHITNEYTIMELAELTDSRKRLKKNSYLQGRLEFLNGKIKRD